VALLEQYVNDEGNPEFERRLAHVDDIMRRYDPTLRALAGPALIGVGSSSTPLALCHPSVFDLAAVYAVGIAKNHAFIDGNKRTAFVDN
jgi:Fic/DOC family protein